MAILDKVRAEIIPIKDGEADLLLINDSTSSNEYLEERHELAVCFEELSQQFIVIPKNKTSVNVENDQTILKVSIPTPVVNKLATTSSNTSLNLRIADPKTNELLGRIQSVKVKGTLTVLHSAEDQEPEFVDLGNSKKEEPKVEKVAESQPSVTEEAPKVEAKPVIQETALKPQPAPTQKSSSGLIIGIIFALLLLAIALVVAWMLLNKTSIDESATPSVSPCSINDNKSLNDADFMNKCLASKPSDADLVKVVEEVMAADRCDLGKRLVTGLARTGHEPLAKQYGDFLNPNLPENKCVAKNKEQAIYWYKKAPNDANAKQLLSEFQ